MRYVQNVLTQSRGWEMPKQMRVFAFRKGKLRVIRRRMRLDGSRRWPQGRPHSIQIVGLRVFVSTRYRYVESGKMVDNSGG